MITAIDTNVLLDVLLPSHAFLAASEAALQEAASRGSLTICDIVYAELCVCFDTQRECDTFLESTGIRVQPLTREDLFDASRALRAYRRRGGHRARILPDFLIGAHAARQASRFLSRDRGFYRQMFPSLQVLDPTQG